MYTCLWYNCSLFVNYTDVQPPIGQPSIFKLLIVGNSGVGKSCIVKRFCSGHFQPDYKETVGMEFQIKTILLNSMPYLLQIWDSAGQARYFFTLLPQSAIFDLCLDRHILSA